MSKKSDLDINIIEVGPRDGLQNEKELLSLDDKFTYVTKLASAGLKTIELTSFVSPKAIPQMADAKELFDKVKEDSFFEGINFPCLVPNMRGMQNAIESGVSEIALFTATSEAFTQKNINATIDESFARMTEVAQEAIKNKIKVRGYISTVFGCPYSSDVGIKSFLDVAKRLLDLGVYEISVGDTIGVGTPDKVDEYLTELLKEIDKEKVAMHFHDTHSNALANIRVSLEKGIRSFDASSGGLGGCPYAKGATGNVATEDVVSLMHKEGLKTGVNLDKLADASLFILDKVKKESPSKIVQNLINEKKR